MDNLLDQDCYEDLEEELKGEVLPKGIDQALVSFSKVTYLVLKLSDTLAFSLECRKRPKLIEDGIVQNLAWTS